MKRKCVACYRNPDDFTGQVAGRWTIFEFFPPNTETHINVVCGECLDLWAQAAWGRKTTVIDTALIEKYAKQILMTDCRAPVPVEKKLEYLKDSVKRIIVEEREKMYEEFREYAKLLSDAGFKTSGGPVEQFLREVKEWIKEGCPPKLLGD